jgi:broad specificity phosphatase PhoE
MSDSSNPSSRLPLSYSYSGLSHLYHNQHENIHININSNSTTSSGSNNFNRYHHYPDRSPIPLSIKTIHSDQLALPVWLEAKKQITDNSATSPTISSPNQSPLDQFSVSISSAESLPNNPIIHRGPIDKRLAVKHLQSLAVKKLTVENSEVTLQEFLNNSLNTLSQVDPNPPLDLRSPNAAEILLQFVSETLEIDNSALLIQQVVSADSHGTAKGHSGDAVSLIIDTTTVPPRLCAVVKVFTKSKTFEAELAALTRMQIWLNNTGNINSSTGNALVAVPEAIGAHFALVPNGRVGGVLVMSAAHGIPLDDLFVLLGKKQDNSPERLAVFEQLMEGVKLTAKAFALLHSSHPNSGQHRVRKSYLRFFIDQIEDILQKLAEKLNSGKYRDITAVYGDWIVFDLAYLRRRIAPLIAAALEEPGFCCVSHGDAHLGNVFYAENRQLITFIDVPTANQSVGMHGEPIGSGARDLGNFYHKISQIGHANGLNFTEITTLQQQFLFLYTASTKFPVPSAAFHFFHVRSTLGEFHRSIKDHNTNQQKLIYLLDAFNSAEIDRKRQKSTEVLPYPINLTQFNDAGDEDDHLDDEIAQKIAVEQEKNEKKQQKEEEKKQLAEIETKNEEEAAEHGEDSLQNDEQQDEKAENEEEISQITANHTQISTDDPLIAPNSANFSKSSVLLANSPFIARNSSFEGNSTAGLPPFLMKRRISGLNSSQNPYEERAFSPIPGEFAQKLPLTYPPHAVSPQINKNYPLTNLNGARILVVLGAPLKTGTAEPDIYLESRLKQSVSVFYRQINSISAVILSGGRSPGSDHSIARVMERWLRPFGIRSSSSTFALFREELSTDFPSFHEEFPVDLVRQALCIRSLLRCRGMKHGSLIIISSDFQLAAVALVFNRLFHASTGKITLEYVGAATPKAQAPSAMAEQNRLKELPGLIKELRLQYPSGFPYIYCSLVDCCRAGSLEQLKLQVEAQGKPLINTDRDNLGLTPLIIASEQGFYDCVEFLIQQGADVNQRSTLGATALHFAVVKGRLSIVELLLNNGAAVSKETRGGQPGLWIGSKKPHEISRGKQLASTLELQDSQPIFSVITLLIQPEALTANQFQEDLKQQQAHKRKTSTFSFLNNGSNNEEKSQNSIISPANKQLNELFLLSPLSPRLVSPSHPSTLANSGDLSSSVTLAGPEELLNLPSMIRTEPGSTPPITKESILPGNNAENSEIGAKSEVLANPTTLSVISAVINSNLAPQSVPHNLIPIKSSKCVFLLRHAESLWNYNGSHRVRGLIDTTLTNSGIKQAKIFGQLLRNTNALQRLGINLVVISPLTRALQTYMHSIRWFLYPQYSNLQAPMPNRGLDKELKALLLQQQNNSHTNIEDIPVEELQPRKDVRVHVNSDLAEQLLSTGTIGRSPDVLKQDFADPTLMFSHLRNIWWYAPERELETVSKENNAQKQEDSDSEGGKDSPKNSSTNANAANQPAAKVLLPLSNTKVYLKKEPIENLYDRIAAFKQWLNAQSEDRILVIGHGTYFSHMINCNQTTPNNESNINPGINSNVTNISTGVEDAFKTNLFLWRL